ncbi:hypothetical protein [Streptomyces sp. NPDC048295]|uniref:hypothetical protein n=1 Tax=Streptomyces sp. NPDC048295 TaxID=3154617 RepID=UPI00343BAF65
MAHESSGADVEKTLEYGTVLSDAVKANTVTAAADAATAGAGAAREALDAFGQGGNECHAWAVYRESISNGAEKVQITVGDPKQCSH